MYSVNNSFWKAILGGGLFLGSVITPLILHLQNEDSIETFDSFKPEETEEKQPRKEEPKQELTKKPESKPLPQKTTETPHLLDESYWGLGTPAISVANDTQKADDIIDTLEDYTVSINGACWRGTGWFFDFLPEENGKYPTIWYLGTNLHVSAQFFLGNRYRQKSPTYKGEVESRCYNSNGRSTFSLGRRWSSELYKGEKRVFDEDEDGEMWWKQEVINRKGSTPVTRINVKNKKVSELLNYTSTSSSVTFAYSEVTNSSNHFYYAVNYLTPEQKTKYNRTEDYSKDFSVLEVMFGSEEEARIITNNLYDKYYSKTKSNNKKSLNFLYDKYDSLPNEHIKDKAFFTLGYSGNGWTSTIPYSNYSRKNKWGSRIWESLAEYDSFWNKTASAPKVNGKLVSTWGYRYVLQNTYFKGGSSGSLVVDLDGNVIGLFSSADRNSPLGRVEALRAKAKESTMTPGTYLSPAYDVFRGAEGQLYSYRTELEVNRKPTWMAKQNGWKIEFQRNK